MNRATAIEELEKAVARLEYFERKRGAHLSLKPRDALNTLKGNSDAFVTEGTLMRTDPFVALYTTTVTGAFAALLKELGMHKDAFGLPLPIFQELERPEFIQIIVRRDPERS